MIGLEFAKHNAAMLRTSMKVTRGSRLASSPLLSCCDPDFIVRKISWALLMLRGFSRARYSLNWSSVSAPVRAVSICSNSALSLFVFRNLHADPPPPIGRRRCRLLLSRSPHNSLETLSSQRTKKTLNRTSCDTRQDIGPSTSGGSHTIVP